MPKLAWLKRNDGAFVAEREGLDLTVYRRPDRVARKGSVQFVVAARDRAVRRAVIGSGLAADLAQGMRLAEGMANQFRRDVPAGRSQVMVVDDDTSVRNALADVLRDDGYDVVEVSSAEGALRRLDWTRYPIVLVTDVNLGEGMSGLELATEVRNLWPTVSVLLISGGDADLIADDAATIGFLPKPISSDSLLECVATIFARMRGAPAGNS
jgi:CheY-like chemotaxis protein